MKLSVASSDAEVAACLECSDWERMAAESADYESRLYDEYSEAISEMWAAKMLTINCPGNYANAIHAAAEVRLERIEMRLGL